MMKKMLGCLMIVSLMAAFAVRAETAKPDEVKLGDATKGKSVFEGQTVAAANCTLCHGIAGKGDGVGAAAIKAAGVAPRDFTDKAVMEKITNAGLIKAITEGGAAVGKSMFMTPWKGILTDDQIKDVAAYIRTFAK